MNQTAEQSKLAEINSSQDNNSTAKQSIGYVKSLRSRSQRRSLSGAPLSCLFETKFQHLKAFQKTQNEARGLNFLLAPVSAALYRSSMPVTPIATPKFEHGGIRFSEQSFHERMRARLQSPRLAAKTTEQVAFEQKNSISEAPESQLDKQKTKEEEEDEVLIVEETVASSIANPTRSSPEPTPTVDTTAQPEPKLPTPKESTTTTTTTAKQSSARGKELPIQREQPQKTSRRQRRKLK